MTDNGWNLARANVKRTNFPEAGRILYVSAVDISRPDGPSGNEREFVTALFEIMGERAAAILPTPRHPMADLPSSNIEFVSAWNPVRYSEHLTIQPALVLAVDRFLRKHSVDLIVARIGLVPIDFAAIAWRHRIPLAIKTVGDMTFLQHGDHGRGLKKALATALAPVGHALVTRVLNEAIAVDVCTPELEQMMAKEFGVPRERITLVPNATNTRRFLLKDKHESRRRVGVEHLDPILGFVGGRPKDKGARHIVELLPQLRDRYPSIGAIIVGSPVDELEKRAKTLGIDERCLFTGRMPYDRVVDYLNCADVGFALETKRVSYVGNSYQKIRQYLACGMAVVSVPGSDFLLEQDLGSIVDSDDMDAVERATIHWLEVLVSEHDTFRERAHAYVREHLSMQGVMRQRFAFWNKRLAETRTS